MAQKTMSWTMPSEYTDGTPILADKAPKIAIKVLRDGVHIYTTIDGATEWPIEVTPGVTNDWSLIAVLDGQESEPSPPYRYTHPFRTPNPPEVIGIG